MSVSMRDVAALANVSQRTVSNVVNDFVHVKPDTRARVQRAIEMLGYKPNLSARKLRGGRSGLVALALPEIAAPYFAELADRIQQHAAERDQVILIEQTGGTRQREISVLSGYPSAMIDGLIINPNSITSEDLAEYGDGVPTVLLGERIDLTADSVGGRFAHISIDNVEAARVATDHLIGLGRTRIAAIAAVEPLSASAGPGVRRTQGYLSALHSAGLSSPPELRVSVKQWKAPDGFAAVNDLLDRGVKFDALFCFNDTLAFGALSALHSQGIRVPEDVAILGWDDTAESRFSYPPLTTIAPAVREIAELSVDRLLRLIDGDESAIEDVQVSFELAIRGSTVSRP
ncbi:LacI family DNA-binding transcriptional regulator [uncultured Microbacterium sp.]|uniref:LacI family DNA-binding transcriptional regulator n=1 Tax=uncultured Microbacterium sp. TaxID=191216 RepID=UPI0035CBA359